MAIFGHFGLLEANFGQPRRNPRNFEIGMVSTNEMCPMDPETEKRNIWGVWNGFLGLLASEPQKSDFRLMLRQRIKTNDRSSSHRITICVQCCLLVRPNNKGLRYVLIDMLTE